MKIGKNNIDISEVQTKLNGGVLLGFLLTAISLALILFYGWIGLLCLILSLWYFHKQAIKLMPKRFQKKGAYNL